jgi:2-C-methyl-D-erythritol 2,4-cyclodiphosphate synthase
MRETLADALGIAIQDVSIKATTTDGLGFTGRGEGIACFAVVMLESTA